MRVISFFDDVSLVATTYVTSLLEERFEITLHSVSKWMTLNGAELAMEKTEAIVLTNRNK